MRTTTEVASFLNISSAVTLNKILEKLKIQRKDRFGKWILILNEHKKFEKYKEIVRNGKRIQIRVFTDEGVSFIKNLLKSNGYDVEKRRGEELEKYKLSNKNRKNREYY